MSNQTKAVIFDFDGTIADSLEVVLEIAQSLTKRTRELTNADLEDLRQSSTKEIITKLGVGPWQIPLFIARGRHEMTKRMDRIQPFVGMPEALKELSAQYDLYVLSTNSAQNIGNFLQKHELDQYFTGIYGGVGLLGKAKSLRKLQAKESLRATECVYVGDETRDVEAAKRAGMRCLAVAWGYSHPDALRQRQPTAVVDSPYDLVRIVEGL